MTIATSSLCPCQSQTQYQDCCGLLHNGKNTALNAEQLMRSSNHLI
ncbi:SEC-C metal-binding domain-containing protein [Chelonobacter oris]|nr:SEC-C metal-binding domain-containing protein [Chelonobacter oris]